MATLGTGELRRAEEAFASTIYEGVDYSYSTSSNRKAVICDKEADARMAYVKDHAGNLQQGGHVNDQGGSSGSCWQNASDVTTSIMELKTCADTNNRPDSCSKWDSHY